MRFLLIYSSLGYGTSVPTPRIALDLAFPLFFLRFCGGVLSGVSIQYFLQQIPVLAFTTAKFTCWLFATKFIYALVAAIRFRSVVCLSCLGVYRSPIRLPECLSAYTEG